jgi:formylglycine-generating enzyme required for sulfatase activity
MSQQVNNQPIGFMSYVRADDAHENGRLSDFCARLSGEVRLHSGDEFPIFQDRNDIAWGQQWARRLEESLAATTFLIPIITPGFFKSDACRAELERFLTRERQLQRGDLILPVYYVEAAVLENASKRAGDQLAHLIHGRQYIDWRELRHQPLNAPQAGEMLARMARQIITAIDRGIPPKPLASLTLPVTATVTPAVAPTAVKPVWASATGSDAIGPWAEITVNHVVQRLRWIKPGRFLMGSPPHEIDRHSDEGPQHQVTIRQGLWLADTACTQALWQAVMGDNPSHFNELRDGGPQHPVESVSWHMVQVFLEKLTNQLPACRVTLPNEAEWEYACRAGSTGAFSFGQNIHTDQVNYHGKHPYIGGRKGQDRQRTLPVGALPANAWGLYEMHGNVWEWCADPWREYDGTELDDPGLVVALDVLAGDLGAARALRGGGWILHAHLARSASRIHDWPGGQDGSTGFRFALRFSSPAGGG